jgi:phosphatidylserine/phosphatidylglycerophosphate/cardiolipin synthase-like enzyme
MEGYQIWLIFLALAIISVSIIQLLEIRNKKLQKDIMQLQKDRFLRQDQLRKRESQIDQLQRNSSKLLKWKDRALELEGELKRIKSLHEYASIQRLQFLEDFIDRSQTEPHILFLETSPARGGHRFEDRLCRMLEEARFEIIIMSPWIKRQTWNRVKGPLRKFCRKGGKLSVFMRASDSDYSLGLSDNLAEEISELGGEVIAVDCLHAKIYLADRREAIITSANLTKGGIENNYEGGIWVSDPTVLADICRFAEDVRRAGQRLDQGYPLPSDRRGTM